MTYNPNQINPPEPHPRDVVTCHECHDEICREDAHNVGGGDAFPVWICSQGCLVEYAAEVTADFAAFRSRSDSMVKKLTHGVGPSGHQDWGLWDFCHADVPGAITLISKPDTGQYRLVQLGGAE